MFTGVLHPYQDPVVDAALARGKFLIAASMGTGKTPMSIAVAEELLGCGDIGLCVIVCPANLRYQWAKALAKFTDLPRREIKVGRENITVPKSPYCIVVDGKAFQANGIKYSAADDRRRQFAAVNDNTDYVIMSYETVVEEHRQVRKLRPGMAVLDECTQIKTFRSRRAKVIKKVLSPEYRVANTGTPIENGKPEELFCADESTEIFTRRGWLRYTDVCASDQALTLNHGTGLSEWQMIQSANIFSVEDHQMLLMEHRDHSSLTTLSHRWPVERVVCISGKPDFSERVRVWATSESFQHYDRFAIAAERSDIPSFTNHTDALVELVAWLYTEGHVRKLRNGTPGSAIYITQNSGTEGEQRIISALTEVFGGPTPRFPRTGQQVDGVPRWRIKYDGKASVFVLNTTAGAQLLLHAPGKVPSLDFLLSLTASQLALFIEISMLADNNGKQCFSQKNPAAAEAFQYACLLAGYGVSIAQEPKTSYDRHGEPYHMTRVTLRKRKYSYPANSRREIINYTGKVWCPTTPNGTWLARRNGKIYFTGNSIMQWIDDTVLGRWDLFDKTYIDRDDDTGLVSGWKNLNVLRARLAPAMARLSRDEQGVREYMPEPVHDEWVVPFISGRVRDAYMAMGRDLYAELGKLSRWGGGFDVADYYGGRADESTKVGKIMAVHTSMEQLLDHPDLVVESGMNYEATQNLPPNKRKGSRYAYRVWQEGLLDDVWDSVKLPYLKREVGKLISEGRKVLIFSKFRPMLQYIEDYLGVPCVQYHGQMSAAQKAGAVESFSRKDGPQVFLSSHAGAYGMDMYMATDLINFDNTNIAGRADQVNARHVRASSEFAEVYIHSMIVSGTIEERIMSMQALKRRVGSAVTDGRGADRFGRVENDVVSLTAHLEETIEGL